MVNHIQHQIVIDVKISLVESEIKNDIGIPTRMPDIRMFVQFVMMNEQRLDISKISPDERKILRKWKEEDFIEGGASGLSITKEFWNLMCEILWEGYVVGGSVE